MPELPEGWDTYDPNNHELTGDSVYEQARSEARSAAEIRRSEARLAMMIERLPEKEAAFYAGAGQPIEGV